MRYGEMGEAAPPRNGHGGSGGATNGTSGEWGPFKSAASYGTSMAVVICLLFSAFAFGLLLMAAGRFLLRRLRRVPPEKPVVLSSAGGGAAIVYAAGETELADSAAVCAICLSEFADGETVRVLSPCRHGFHAECVEAWWAASATAAAAAKPPRRSSPPCCPLCRAFVCLSSPAPETKAQITVGSSGA